MSNMSNMSNMSKISNMSKKKIYMSKKFEVEKNSKSDTYLTSYQPSIIANPTEQPTKERKKKFQ